MVTEDKGSAIKRKKKERGKIENSFPGFSRSCIPEANIVLQLDPRKRLTSLEYLSR